MKVSRSAGEQRHVSPRPLLPLLLLLGAAPAAAEPPRRLLVEGGLVVGAPVALPTGLSVGIGAGVLRRVGPLAFGARVAWSEAAESTLAWTVQHDDVRLRLVAAVGHTAGRGSFALRLGAGGTLVCEDRSRNQGERAGLTGSDLHTTAYRLVPAADLELAVTLRVAADLSVIVSGGPSLHLLEDGARFTFVGGIGVAWAL
jgi:hypothetical protein